MYLRRLLLATLVLAAACGEGGPSSDGPPAGEARCDPAVVPADGAAGWSELAPSPLSARATAITAWTGCELLVVRGSGNFSDGCSDDGEVTLCGEPPRNDGAAYDPATNTWRLLPAAPLGDDRSSYGIEQPRPYGAWTGDELLVVGGEDWGAAAYAPATDTWRSLPEPPVPPRTGFTLTVAGRRAVLFGGTLQRSTGDRDQTFFADGAVLDLDTAAWRPLPEPPAGARAFHAAFAVDDEVVVVGGLPGRADPALAADAVEAYDVAAGTWRPLPPFPGGSRGKAVAVGTDLVAVGTGEGHDRTFLLAHGAEAWTELGTWPFDAFVGPDLVAAGDQVVAIGGSAIPPGPPVPGAAALDLGTGEWRPLAAPPNDIGRRLFTSLVWTGADVLVWGGEVHNGLTSKTAADGARYPLPPVSTG